MSTPSVTELPRIIEAVASWQQEGSPIQVHPGDLGWYGRFGAESLAAALRVWSRKGDAMAVGFLDESELIRMAISPAVGEDHVFANRIADDFVDSLGDVLPSGRGVVEARFGSALQQSLSDRGWTEDDPWTPLYRDLASPVPSPSLQVKVVGVELIEDRVMVEAAAFPGSSLSADRWRQMAEGYAYRTAECLVGYDEDETPVAATTVWSAGPGRPGVIEPLGVHGDHRGRGYGVAITLAAAEALRRMACSSATVATPSSNAAAVATYLAAGFVTQGEVTDFCRP
ncbi:GNAT family N-acetyltransferase [Microbacterium sp. KR10-403]|uniref:GNAT family N-acetyltransferase n=1 Tax=Microbacterium sp. KR10-403 TaxID=3158581 RepID=UPI0032E4AA2E